jgi:hypothetical protein
MKKKKNDVLHAKIKKLLQRRIFIAENSRKWFGYQSLVLFDEADSI